MDPWYLEDLRYRVPVPKLFRSVEKGGAFARCVDCERDLLATETPYLVEKALRGSETVYEFAICMECRDSLEERLSRESRDRVARFFLVHVRGILSREARIRMAVEEERERWLRAAEPQAADAGPLLLPWLDRCVLFGTAAEQCGERVVLALCQRQELLVGSMPWMIGEPALEQFQGILSKQTREELDGWKDEHMGTPPEFEELLKGPRVVIV